MNITPTMAGGLCIEPESEADWMVLQMIGSDIGRSGHLAEALSDLMEDDEGDWGEFVLPDIKQTFRGQTQMVTRTIDDAHENEEKAVFIPAKHGDAWYGAINQARHTLQARYQFDSVENIEVAPAELRSAYFRDRFYLTLQSLLLDYVMEEM
ncbi:MAG: hypothetical protein ACPG32_00900 [Akkermansiaceae bacterium]